MTTGMLCIILGAPLVFKNVVNAVMMVLILAHTGNVVLDGIICKTVKEIDNSSDYDRCVVTDGSGEVPACFTSLPREDGRAPSRMEATAIHLRKRERYVILAPFYHDLFLPSSFAKRLSVSLFTPHTPRYATTYGCAHLRRGITRRNLWRRQLFSNLPS